MCLGETSRHLFTRVREHLCPGKNSHIFKHLEGSSSCKDASDESCFKVLDSGSTYNSLRNKEAFYIMEEVLI